MDSVPTDENETRKFFFDFQTKAVAETVNYLYRGVAFYLAIVAVVVSYVFTQDIGDERKILFLYVGLAVSLLAAVAATVTAWGILTGLKDMETGLKRIDEDIFQEFMVEDFFKRGRMTMIIIGICAFGALVIVSISMMALMLSNGVTAAPNS